MSALGKIGKRVTWESFCEKFNNYTLENFRHAEDVMCIETDPEDLTTAFKEIHITKNLTEDEEKRIYK